MGIVVLGAGGHARVCIELLRASGADVQWCIGGPEEAGECVGVPVLGGDHHLELLRQQGCRQVFVAIGSNVVRRRLATRAIDLGYTLVNAISPSAVISPTAQLGVGVAVMAGAVINAQAVVGDLVVVNTGATIDHDCVIGEGTHVGPQSALAGSVRVGAETFLGIGTSVIPEVRIGDRVTVGAGAVVISDIGDDATAVGVPASIVSKQETS